MRLLCSRKTAAGLEQSCDIPFRLIGMSMSLTLSVVAFSEIARSDHLSCQLRIPGATPDVERVMRRGEMTFRPCASSAV